MDTKQMDFETNFNNKLTIDHNLIKRLLFFVHNLEEKLLSVKTVHEKLYKLLSVVSNTHQTILEELIEIKTVVNEINVEEFQDEDEIIPIDETKSEWDDDDEDIQPRKSKRKMSPSTRQNDRLLLNSASSYNSSSTIENRLNSSTSKRSSNLKKSDQSLSRIKSPKSVTFSLNQNQQTIIEPIQHLSTDKKNEIISAIVPLSSSHISEDEIIPNNGNILTHIRIHEIESQNGDYLRLLNLSNSDDYDLSGHYLQQNITSKPLCRFRFPQNTIIRAGHTVTVWCGHLTDINPQPPHIFVWKEQRKWATGPEYLTILIKPNGQSIAWFRNSHRVNTDQSSSDILFVHSKSNVGTSDRTVISSNSNNSRQSRLSAFDLNGNNKPPFAYSPNNPIHPDHNGRTGNIPNDLRSQMHQRGGISQLLNRPKSSPFASHTGCKQDLISRHFLHKQQTQEQKQATVKNCLFNSVLSSNAYLHNALLLIGNISLLRVGHKSTFFVELDGTASVIITGGALDIYHTHKILTEKYIVAAACFISSTKMNIPQRSHTADRINSMILLGRGNDGKVSQSIATFYDSLTEINMSTPRSLHTSTILYDQFIFIGDVDSNGYSSDTRHLFNGSSFIPLSNNMIVLRTYHTATLLPDRNLILIYGGINENTIQFYDETLNRFLSFSSKPLIMSAQRAN